MSGRIRTVKPEWLEDERMVFASSEARVLSIALILMADDHGRGRANVRLLNARVFPANPPETLAKAIEELRSMDFVSLYRSDSQNYYEIRNWTKHQKVDKPGKPRVPAPLAGVTEYIPETLAKVIETLAPDPDLYPDLDHYLLEQKKPLLLLEAPKAKPKKLKEEPAESVVFNRRYKELYEQHLKKAPVMTTKENAQLKSFLNRFTAEAFELLEAFFASKNPFYKARGYSVTTLVNSGDSLRAENKPTHQAMPTAEEQRRAFEERIAREEQL